MAYYVIITYQDGKKVKGGPFENRAIAEQALANLFGRTDVRNAELSWEPDMPIGAVPRD